MPFAVPAGVIVLALVFPSVGEFFFETLPSALAGASSALFEGSPEAAVADASQAPIVMVPMGMSQAAQAAAPYESAILVPQDSSVVGVASDTFGDMWSTLVPLSVFVSLLLASSIIYSFIRIKQIKHAEKEKYHPHAHHEPAAGTPEEKTKTQLRWEGVKAHAESSNENDWRHAIIDADIMLDELLDAQGYRGETMGDKMKQVERSDFATIDLAWEAHKVRNKIAHEGSAHSLNQREVRRVIALFEQVFKEFKYV